ncbi:(2Fe-2S)-binding protein [Actinokineospora sp.]|uniref:(2Fe-2S)-binding protein n=1 Tax=Actinokineospora sp. TaxID=1872133 RepID=UPI004037B0CF
MTADARQVYRVLNARLPHHAGAAVAGLASAPVSVLTDADWVDAQIVAAGKRYRCADRTVLGVLWWYSASSVLLAPTVESLVAAGVALDPGSVTLYLHPDGRPLAARAEVVCAEPGPRLRSVIGSAAAAIAGVTGAPERALWAIATDSLANRVLWAGGAAADAVGLAAAVGPELPVPRFVSVAGRAVVRRASCCLIYAATGEAKCVSCPRQTPEERGRRLTAALG